MGSVLGQERRSQVDVGLTALDVQNAPTTPSGSVANIMEPVIFSSRLSDKRGQGLYVVVLLRYVVPRPESEHTNHHVFVANGGSHDHRQLHAPDRQRFEDVDCI